jgi:REP element-mobilizing transposase RayT
MLRGNNGHDIFFSDADRYRMCLLLQQSAERFGHIIEAYCFMTNHIHLAIRVMETDLSKFMHYLGFRFARYINRKYKRVGHLFQGRFQSVLVDDVDYLKELVRYIHLNPVRANIVSTPENYSWSSHRVYLGIDQVVWLSRDRILHKFHPILDDAISNFNKFVLSGIGIETVYDFKSGLIKGILGDDTFIKQVLATTNTTQTRKIELAALVDKICEENNLSIEEFCAQGKTEKPSYARALASFLVREIEGLSLEQLGKFLDRHPSGLSKLANRLKTKSSQDPLVAKQIQEMREWIFDPISHFYPIKMSECQA